VTAGVAGLVAGSLAMAAGEFVSVSSQRDSERADLQLEEQELRDDPEGELRELTSIYQKRGRPLELACQVAAALTERDALGANARDELGLEQERRARPLQAAGASALSFSAGAVLPVISVALMPAALRAPVCVAVTVLALAALGSLGARLGGGNQRRATVRVVGWGAVAMAITAGIGALVGGVA
jgi:vacuolar iron transporter family protein